jgi:TPR repeat protein
LLNPELHPKTVHGLVACASIVTFLRRKLGIALAWPFARQQQSLEVRCTSLRLEKYRTVSAKIADEQRRAGQCAKALASYMVAFSFGDQSALAMIANYLWDGRCGVPANPKVAYALVQMGKLYGNLGCFAVLAWMEMTTSSHNPAVYWYAAQLLKNASPTWFLPLASAYLLTNRPMTRREAKLCQEEIADCVGFGLIEAATDGYDRVMFAAGNHIMSHGHRSDYAQAYGFFDLSARQGFPPAMWRLGGCFRNGWGVEVDLREARKWYKRASAAGCDCSEELAELAKLLPAEEMAEEMA